MSLSENPCFSQDFPSELPFLSGLFHLIPKFPTHSYNLIVEIVDRSVKILESDYSRMNMFEKLTAAEVTEKCCPRRR